MAAGGNPSQLDSVVDNAFYFPAGSSIPGQSVPELPQWEQLEGEQPALARARRSAAQLQQQLVHDAAQMTLHEVHRHAFGAVLEKLASVEHLPQVPGVLLHTGELAGLTKLGCVRSEPRSPPIFHTRHRNQYERSVHHRLCAAAPLGATRVGSVPPQPISADSLTPVLVSQPSDTAHQCQ